MCAVGVQGGYCGPGPVLRSGALAARHQGVLNPVARNTVAADVRGWVLIIATHHYPLEPMARSKVYCSLPPTASGPFSTAVASSGYCAA